VKHFSGGQTSCGDTFLKGETTCRDKFKQLTRGYFSKGQTTCGETLFKRLNNLQEHIFVGCQTSSETSGTHF